MFAIQLASNPPSSDRRKRIDVRHHLLRELVSGGEVGFQYVRLGQHAGIMAKTLSGASSEYHREVATYIEWAEWVHPLFMKLCFLIHSVGGIESIVRKVFVPE